MKIIFDNEEQEKAFFEHIAADYCPGIFGMKDLDELSCKLRTSCDECWANCGIEMEVKEDKG